MPYCQKCGHKLDPEDKYCPKCGKKVEPEVEEKSREEEEEEKPDIEKFPDRIDFD